MISCLGLKYTCSMVRGYTWGIEIAFPLCIGFNLSPGSLQCILHVTPHTITCVDIDVHIFNFLRGMGDEFRAWYGQISQLRSLLPSNTPIVALTATATHFVKDRIIRALQMTPVQLITKPSNRPNLRYSVERVNRDVHVAFKWLVSDLKRKRTSLPRVIVFCRSINMCASLYKMFLTELKKESYMYEPC